MKLDIFFSFSKMNLGKGMPADTFLYENLFRQIRAADDMGFRRAWVGEAHFSLKTEQVKQPPLLPHFNGELCINTDILQIAGVIMHQTYRIEIGSAIRNILVNGGPIAHAEAVRTFLTIYGAKLRDSGRKLNIGFGMGRFNYANEVYGIKPRSEVESLLWPAVRGLILREAAEIFLRLLRGETIGSRDIAPKIVRKEQCKDTVIWDVVLRELGLPASSESVTLPPTWEFEPVQIIPADTDLQHLRLVLGSHDASLQEYANQFLPVQVFNLSVTPGATIDATHERMKSAYHPDGGRWDRSYMPRTIMIFVRADAGMTEAEQDIAATAEAREAMIAYWRAMEGTVDQAKVESGMENAVYGSPARVIRMLKERFHPEDCLMTWFDFNTNDADLVIHRMRTFMETVAPHIQS
jgi:alkanesulfonate monooxygenase SsuD/methylene tetrahydromethanopterin reductase-like flavin-dependent oxidoreductase (luciferase family)